MVKLAAFVAPYLLEATARFVDGAARLPGVALGGHHARLARRPAATRPRARRGPLAGRRRVRSEQLVGCRARPVRQAGRPGRAPPGGPGAAAGAPRPGPRGAGHRGHARRTSPRTSATSRNEDVLRAAGLPCARHALVRRPRARAASPDRGRLPAGGQAAGRRRRDSTFRLDDERRARRAGGRPRRRRRSTRRCWRSSSPATSTPSTASPSAGRPSGTRSPPTGPRRWRCCATPGCSGPCCCRGEIDGPEFAAIREAGPAALRALGMDTGCRTWSGSGAPTGASRSRRSGRGRPAPSITSAISFAHDLDFYAAWAEADDQRRVRPAGAAVRGRRRLPARHGRGACVAVHGLEDLQAEIGPLVVEAALPRPGQAPTGTYEGEG